MCAHDPKLRRALYVARASEAANSRVCSAVVASRRGDRQLATPGEAKELRRSSAGSFEAAKREMATVESVLLGTRGRERLHAPKGSILGELPVQIEAFLRGSFVSRYQPGIVVPRAW